MALRQRINQKSASSKFVEKSVRIKSVDDIQMRKALREVGNRLQYIPIKKNGAVPEQQLTLSINVKPLTQAERPPKNLPAPQVGSIKTTAAAPIKKAMKGSDIAFNLVCQPPNAEIKAPGRDCAKSYSSRRLDIIDPDECSKNDPDMVCEYVEDIFSYLRAMENKFPIRKNFLEGHDTSPLMRKILIDWIVEVHMNFKMLLETLHLCVAIMDRYLQKNKNVGRATLQLIGISSLLVAAKYEETFIPPLSDFVYVCDNTYSKKQILSMEVRIVKQLDCSFGRPLSVHFLRRYNKVAQVQDVHHSLGKFLLELALLEYDMSHVSPSLQAAAACCLSVGIMNGLMDLSTLWTPTLVRYTNYKYSEFKTVILSLANILLKTESPKFQTIRKKYASSSHDKISLNPKLNGPLVGKLKTSKK